MTQIDQIITDALAGSPETHVAILAREVLRLREARTVVAPELPTWEDGESKLRRGEKLTALEKFVMDHDWHKTDATFRDGLEAVFAELRAIPADRVLGEGMVAVSCGELDALNQIASSVALPPSGCARILDIDWAEATNGRRNLDALRANQGGV